MDSVEVASEDYFSDSEEPAAVEKDVDTLYSWKGVVVVQVLELLTGYYQPEVLLVLGTFDEIGDENYYSCLDSAYQLLLLNLSAAT